MSENSKNKNQTLSVFQTYCEAQGNDSFLFRKRFILKIKIRLYLYFRPTVRHEAMTCFYSEKDSF